MKIAKTEEEKARLNVEIAKLFGFKAYGTSITDPDTRRATPDYFVSWNYYGTPFEHSPLHTSSLEYYLPDFVGMIERYIEITENVVRSDCSDMNRKLCRAEVVKANKEKRIKEKRIKEITDETN